MVEPTRQQDRESAVTIYVARRSHTAGRQRINPIVKCLDKIPYQGTRDLLDIFRGYIDLNLASDPFENTANRGVIAGTGGVSIAHQDMKRAFERRKTAGSCLVTRLAC